MITISCGGGSSTRIIITTSITAGLLVRFNSINNIRCCTTAQRFRAFTIITARTIGARMTHRTSLLILILLPTHSSIIRV